MKLVLNVEQILRLENYWCLVSGAISGESEREFAFRLLGFGLWALGFRLWPFGFGLSLLD